MRISAFFTATVTGTYQKRADKDSRLKVMAKSFSSFAARINNYCIQLLNGDNTSITKLAMPSTKIPPVSGTTYVHHHIFLIDAVLVHQHE